MYSVELECFLSFSAAGPKIVQIKKTQQIRCGTTPPFLVTRDGLKIWSFVVRRVDGSAGRLSLISTKPKKIDKFDFSFPLPPSPKILIFSLWYRYVVRKRIVLFFASKVALKLLLEKVVRLRQ